MHLGMLSIKHIALDEQSIGNVFMELFFISTFLHLRPAPCRLDDRDIPTASDGAADAKQTGRYVHRLESVVKSGVLDDRCQADIRPVLVAGHRHCTGRGCSREAGERSTSRLAPPSHLYRFCVYTYRNSAMR